MGTSCLTECKHVHMPLSQRNLAPKLKPPSPKVIQLVLEELSHPQPPTPIHINNTTTVGIVNNTIKRQWSRAMEMRYFWLIDGKVQKLSSFHYQPCQEILGNYPLKHQPPTSINMFAYTMCTKNNSPTVLTWAAKPSSWQGCAETLPDPYKGKIPLARVNAFQEPFTSCQVIHQDTLNIRKANQYL